MLVLHVGVEAPQARVHQAAGDVVVDREDGQLFEQDGLGLGEVGQARGLVGLGGGQGDQLVVAGVAPAGAVVLAAGHEHVEEGVRVRVVTDPGRARDLEVEGLLGVQVDLPLLVEELDVQAQVALPAVGDDLGDVLVGLVGVVVDLEGGELGAALAEARLGEERAGLLEVRLEVGPAVHLDHRVGPHARGREAVGHLLAGLGDVGHDPLAVDREGHGAPHARVVEGGLGDVDPVEVGAQVGRRVEVLPGEQARDDVGDGAVDVVDLAHQVEVQARAQVVDGQDVDRVEGHLVPVPVLLALAQADAVVDPPELDPKGTVGDQVLRPQPLELPGVGPALLDGLDGVAGDREGGVEGADVEEVGGGLVELDDEGALVGGAQAEELFVDDPLTVGATRHQRSRGAQVLEGPGLDLQLGQPLLAAGVLEDQVDRVREVGVHARHHSLERQPQVLGAEHEGHRSDRLLRAQALALLEVQGQLSTVGEPLEPEAGEAHAQLAGGELTDPEGRVGGGVQELHLVVHQRVLPRSADVPELVGVLRCRQRVEHPPPGVLEVAGRHRPPVAPAGVVADAEGVGAPVLRDLPGLRGPGQGLQGLGVLDAQPLVEGPHHPPLGHAADRGGVEGRDLRGVVEGEVGRLQAGGAGQGQREGPQTRQEGEGQGLAQASEARGGRHGGRLAMGET